MRPSWDSYFMKLATEVARMSTCDRLRVGCVLVKDKRIIATGFNGSISGQPHCDEEGHIYNSEGRCVRTIHAEQNALLQCAKYGISCEGATAYVTHEPCEHCLKLLIQAGIKQIVYLHEYKNKWNQFIHQDFKHMIKKFEGELIV